MILIRWSGLNLGQTAVLMRQVLINWGQGVGLIQTPAVSVARNPPAELQQVGGAKVWSKERQMKYVSLFWISLAV